MDTGKGIVGSPDQLDNKMLPEWKPTKVIDLLKAFLSLNGLGSDERDITTCLIEVKRERRLRNQHAIKTVRCLMLA